MRKKIICRDNDYVALLVANDLRGDTKSTDKVKKKKIVAEDNFI